MNEIESMYHAQKARRAKELQALIDYMDTIDQRKNIKIKRLAIAMLSVQAIVAVVVISYCARNLWNMA